MNRLPSFPSTRKFLFSIHINIKILFLYSYYCIFLYHQYFINFMLLITITHLISHPIPWSMAFPSEYLSSSDSLVFSEEIIVLPMTITLHLHLSLGHNLSKISSSFLTFSSDSILATYLFLIPMNLGFFYFLKMDFQIWYYLKSLEILILFFEGWQNFFLFHWNLVRKIFFIQSDLMVEDVYFSIYLVRSLYWRYIDFSSLQKELFWAIFHNWKLNQWSHYFCPWVINFFYARNIYDQRLRLQWQVEEERKSIQVSCSFFY